MTERKATFLVVSIAAVLSLGAVWAIKLIPERTPDEDGLHLRFNVPRCHRLDDRSIGCKVERLKPMKDWWKSSSWEK